MTFESLDPNNTSPASPNPAGGDPEGPRRLLRQLPRLDPDELLPKAFLEYGINLRKGFY